MNSTYADVTSRNRPTETSGDIISEDRNTSLWITGLRPDVSYNALLRGIRKCGRVKQVHVNLPNQANPTKSAATVTFFTCNAAQKLLDQAQAGNFRVQDRTPNVVWNRHRIVEEPAAGRSRVLRILGPPEIVNRAYLETFWARHFYWATDRVTEVGEIADDIAVVWYYFGNWKTQALVARRRLLEHFGHSIVVNYVRDPCGE
jgi:RNA recognition motif-containing protein